MNFTILRTSILTLVIGATSIASATQLIYNGDFQLSPLGWDEVSPVPLVGENYIGSLGLTGNKYAWMGGYSNADDVLSQSIDFGTTAGTATLTFDYEKLVVEANSFDVLKVKVGTDVVDVINLGGAGFGFSGVLTRTVDLSSYMGTGGIDLSFQANTDNSLASSVFIDNVSLQTIPVAEPSTLAAIMTGAIIVRLRRNKKS